MKLYLVFLYLFILNISPSFAVSDCEKTKNPKIDTDCKGKKAEFKTETCCYAKGTQNGTTETECLDINKRDIDTEAKLNETIKKIKEGKYWETYQDPYEEMILDCDPNSSAKYWNVIITLLACCLLF